MNHPVINIIALLSLVYYPSIPILVALIHATLPIWKRLGKISYSIFIALFIGIDLSILLFAWNLRDQILSFRLYDSSWSLLAIPLFFVGLGIGMISIRTLSFRVLVGVPEILPSSQKSELTTSGIYRYLRHPRYLEFILEFFAIALLSGLSVVWIVFSVFLCAIMITVTFEERELIQRFGESYKAYKKNVPRFIPKIRLS